MKNGLNVLVLIALAFYVASPIDLAPGPVDDLIMLLIYVIADRRKLVHAEQEKSDDCSVCRKGIISGKE
jgi:hypothetical protein